MKSTAQNNSIVVYIPSGKNPVLRIFEVLDSLVGIKYILVTMGDSPKVAVRSW